MRYDVIVVGAGPGGSTAARECAERGLSTLLLDKASFPRDKPCGGGVNIRAARLLPFDLAPVVEREIYGIRFSLRLSGAYTRRADAPLTYLTQRSRLDHYLVERAVAAGAKLTRPVATQFYGDRTGGVEDPFGHAWYIATHVEDVPVEELRKRAAAAHEGHA